MCVCPWHFLWLLWHRYHVCHVIPWGALTMYILNMSVKMVGTLINNVSHLCVCVCVCACVCVCVCACVCVCVSYIRFIYVVTVSLYIRTFTVNVLCSLSLLALQILQNMLPDPHSKADHNRVLKIVSISKLWCIYPVSFVTAVTFI